MRFVCVGVISNVVLYVLYVIATTLGVEHKIAMTGLFGIGVLQTFVANKTWSFHYQGRNRSALLRYFVAYLVAYLANLGVMIELVDRLGYSDKVVQGGMIVVVAVLMFAAQKLWVFPQAHRGLSKVGQP